MKNPTNRIVLDSVYGKIRYAHAFVIRSEDDFDCVLDFEVDKYEALEEAETEGRKLWSGQSFEVVCRGIVGSETFQFDAKKGDHRMKTTTCTPAYVRNHFPLSEHHYHTLREAERNSPLLLVTTERSPLGDLTLLELELAEGTSPLTPVSVECDACFDDATTKDYRGQHKFSVCEHHFRMSDLNFFKALKRKTNALKNHEIF